MGADNSINPIRLADALRDAGWEPVPFPPTNSCVAVRVNRLVEICHVMWDLGQHFQAEDFIMRPEIHPMVDLVNGKWLLWWPTLRWDFVGHP